LSEISAYTLTIDTEIYKKARSEMRRLPYFHRPPPPTIDAFRRRLALAVVALFVGVCLGRLFVPNVPLFRDLLPVVSGLLVVVVRFSLSGHGRK